MLVATLLLVLGALVNGLGIQNAAAKKRDEAPEREPKPAETAIPSDGF